MAWRHDGAQWVDDPWTPMYDELCIAMGRHFDLDGDGIADQLPAEEWRHFRPGDFPTGNLGLAGPHRLGAAVTARSQNGYPANDRSLIHTVTVPDTPVRLPVRIGPAGDLLIWAARRWHHEVEPLVAGTCWGYAERTIRGVTELSNHASGTAIDCNAPRHPMGTNPSANFSAAQITAVRRIVADTRGALRWGGDYTGRKDGMHLEIIASEAACAAVINQPTPPPRIKMAVMPWTLPAGTEQKQTIPVPIFRAGDRATLWLVTGWEPAQIDALYFIRDQGPGRTPQQENWGGTGAWSLSPDDRPSFDLGAGCTSIAAMYSSRFPIQCMIVYPDLY